MLTTFFVPLTVWVRKIMQQRSRKIIRRFIACDYTPTLWTRLTRFLEYPELELSNNLTENAIRPIAIGRENPRRLPSLTGSKPRRHVRLLKKSNGGVEMAAPLLQ